MNSAPPLYIWQHADWPQWQYRLEQLADPLAQVRLQQGLLLGRLQGVGWELQQQASLLVLTNDVLTTSAIEGEVLNAQSVRSSLARRLGVDIGALTPADRQVEGMVEMVLDATRHAQEDLTVERLQGWHAALFPTGYSGLSAIRVAQWRDDAQGPMQVVSGGYGRETVHFEAPPAELLPESMQLLLEWVNHNTEHDAVLKAGLAHLWFLTLHPFDDGNGRMARALGDMLLARADGIAQRFYSLSAQIQRERGAYYQILERSQKASMDVTAWLQWFLQAMHAALLAAHGQLAPGLL